MVMIQGGSVADGLNLKIKCLIKHRQLLESTFVQARGDTFVHEFTPQPTHTSHTHAHMHTWEKHRVECMLIFCLFCCVSFSFNQCSWFQVVLLVLVLLVLHPLLLIRTLPPSLPTDGNHDPAVRLFKTLQEHRALPAGVDHHITLNDSTSLFIPNAATHPGTQINVATISCTEVARRMHNGGANRVVTPLACVHVTTEPRMVGLNCPLELRVVAPESTDNLLVMTAMDIRGPWSDCTETFQIQDEEDEEEGVKIITLKSPMLGWIAPVNVEWQPSVIAKQALQDLLREEPISVRLSVFVSIPTSAPSSKTRQVIIHLSPLKARSPLSTAPVQPGSKTYKQIGEGQSFLSTVGSELLVDLEGNFTAENEEESLQQVVAIPESNSDRMVEKWVHLYQPDCDSSGGLTLCGVLKIFDMGEGRRNEVARVPLKASF